MHKLCLTCPVAGMLFRSVKTVPAGQTCQRRPYTPSGAVRHALTGGLRKVLKNCTLKIWKSGGGVLLYLPKRCCKKLTRRDVWPAAVCRISNISPPLIFRKNI